MLIIVFFSSIELIPVFLGSVLGGIDGIHVFLINRILNDDFGDFTHFDATYFRTKK